MLEVKVAVWAEILNAERLNTTHYKIRCGFRPLRITNHHFVIYTLRYTNTETHAEGMRQCMIYYTTNIRATLNIIIRQKRKGDNCQLNYWKIADVYQKRLMKVSYFVHFWQFITTFSLLVSNTIQ